MSPDGARIGAIFIRGFKVTHMSDSANCDRCLIAPGGGSGIPAVQRGGKTFLRDTLERGAEARPDRLLLCFLFPSPPLFLFFLFFFPLFVRFLAGLSSDRSILEDKEQVFPCEVPLLCVSRSWVGRKPRISGIPLGAGQFLPCSFCPLAKGTPVAFPKAKLSLSALLSLFSEG